MAHTFVKDIMRKNAISISQEMTIKDAAESDVMNNFMFII